MTEVLVPVLVSILLIALNGLFVAAEFAIISAPRTAIKQRAAEGNRVAALVARIQDSPRLQDRFIATAQLGISAASLGLGMYGEHLLAEWLAGELQALGAGRWVAAHTLASVIAIAVLSYFHVVIGEMVPKALALGQAERTVLWITPIMQVIQWISFPLIVVLNGIGNGILRLFGINRSEGSTDRYQTPEEIELIVRESHSGGLLRKEAAGVLQELLDFGDLDAGEVMIPRVRAVALPLGSGPDAIREAVRATPHTRYPVHSGTLDNIVGMVHVKDLLGMLAEERAIGPEDVRPVPFVPETTYVEDVLAAMRVHRSQLAVVMDEHGGTAGIVTIEDLFEEVIGEIPEGPIPASPPAGRSGTGVHVLGTTRVEEVGEQLGVTLEHPEVDTVSGLVLALLGRPPELGDTVEYDEVRFEVTAVQGHGVRECVVERVEPRSSHMDAAET